jgi:hypothetical protein
VRNGKPRPGAGELAEPGELDFSGQGKIVRLVSRPVAGNCPSFSTIGWKLVSGMSGETPLRPMDAVRLTPRPRRVTT